MNRGKDRVKDRVKDRGKHGNKCRVLEPQECGRAELMRLGKAEFAS